MRTLVGVVSLVLWCGCAVSKVEVLPALTPIDASRPFFVYGAVKGTACGKEAAAGAMDDLFRVSGSAHGFVAAVVEREEGGDHCVSITARPITYGCTAAPPMKIDESRPMHVVPGPTACAATPDVCTPDCTRFGNAHAGSPTENAAFRERCVSRCRNNETAFMSCVRAATTPADVSRCDSL
jgi:hypothetical protein